MLEYVSEVAGVNETVLAPALLTHLSRHLLDPVKSSLEQMLESRFSGKTKLDHVWVGALYVLANSFQKLSNPLLVEHLVSSICKVDLPMHISVLNITKDAALPKDGLTGETLSRMALYALEAFAWCENVTLSALGEATLLLQSEKIINDHASKSLEADKGSETERKHRSRKSQPGNKGFDSYELSMSSLVDYDLMWMPDPRAENRAERMRLHNNILCISLESIFKELMLRPRTPSSLEQMQAVSRLVLTLAERTGEYTATIAIVEETLLEVVDRLGACVAHNRFRAAADRVYTDLRAAMASRARHEWRCLADELRDPRCLEAKVLEGQARRGRSQPLHDFRKDDATAILVLLRLRWMLRIRTMGAFCADDEDFDALCSDMDDALVDAEATAERMRLLSVVFKIVRDEICRPVRASVESSAGER